jgi:putative ABC transport system permease protein
MYGEDASAERLSGVRATADIFNVLGLTTLLGQFYTAENHVVPNDKVLVLTQSFWETHYQEDPGVIGRTARLDGETYTIVGIAPRAFEAFNASRARFVRPFSWNPANVNPNARHGNNPNLFARLKPGITLGQAQAEADTIERRFYDAGTPQVRTFLDRAGHQIAVRSVQLERVQPMRATLYMLQGGVILVLLTGCVNVANLLGRRAARRAARRHALGVALAALADAVAGGVRAEVAAALTEIASVDQNPRGIDGHDIYDDGRRFIGAGGRVAARVRERLRFAQTFGSTLRLTRGWPFSGRP